MSQDFKEKLKAYSEGRLSEEEKLQMEEELEKLELYQEFLEEQLDEKESSKLNNRADIVKDADKIIKKGKWKARLQNGFITLILFYVFFTIVQTVTAGYYDSGDPSKNYIYTNVISRAIETTKPNAEINGGNFSSGTFFSRNIGVTYVKKVGTREFGQGELSIKFNFNRPTVAKDVNPNLHNPAYFKNPKLLNNGNASSDRESTAWNKLEKLHEGTVAEAYITFDKLHETEEVLKKFQNKNLKLLWFAVDTGFDEADTHYVDNVVGFPNNNFSPRLEDKISSIEADEFAPFGDGKQRNESFIKTLKFLNKYKSITQTVAPQVDIQSALNYVNKNGVKIHGVTITGPTKEILKLKDEGFVEYIYVGETELWNWD